MKLDIDFIKDILNKMNENTEDRTTMAHLLDELNFTECESGDNCLKKLRNHLYILYQSGYISCDNDDLGFIQSNEDICFVSHVKYYFTMNGYQLLEALNNDAIKDKILSGIKDIGITTLKQIPSLALDVLLKLI